MKLLVVASCLLCLSSFVQARMAFRFAAGLESLIDNVDETFTCDDKNYGYYADVQNECKIFHVCHPILNDDGEVAAMDHFSFVCGNQTIFSQETLTCSLPEDAFPCEDAPTLYELVNSEFGKVVLARQNEIDTSGDNDASASAFGINKIDEPQIPAVVAQQEFQNEEPTTDLPNSTEELFTTISV